MQMFDNIDSIKFKNAAERFIEREDIIIEFIKN